MGVGGGVGVGVGVWRVRVGAAGSFGYARQCVLPCRGVLQCMVRSLRPWQLSSAWPGLPAHPTSQMCVLTWSGCAPCMQDPTMQRRTQATFNRWWKGFVAPENIISYSPLLPQLRVAADGSALEFVPESVAMAPPATQQQLHAWQQQQQAGEAQSTAATATAAGRSLSQQQGVWEVDRFISLLLGEILRLRDDANGYGPCGKDFIDHVDIPAEVEAAWGRLSQRYAHLLRV